VISKQKKIIKKFFFILFVFLLLSSKSYAKNCADITTPEKQRRLAFTALDNQLQLNTIVLAIQKTGDEIIANVEKAKDLTQVIQAGLGSLPPQLDQAIENEKSLTETLGPIVQEQYSLAEKMGSALDLLEASTIYGSKCMLLDLELDFLEDKILNKTLDKINKVKDNLLIGQELYADQIDQFFGYIPGDPYAAKLSEVAKNNYGTIVLGVTWSPGGDYFAATGSFSGGSPYLRVYSYGNNALTEVTATAASVGNSQMKSIDWSPGDNYIVIGGSDDGTGNQVRVYQFTPPSTLTYITKAQHGDEVSSVKWFPDWSATTGGYFAIAGDGDTSTGNKEVRIYKFDPSLPIPDPLLPALSEDFEGREATSCSWSSDGTYLAVGGESDGSPNDKIIKVFEFATSPVSLTDVASFEAGANTTVSSLDWSSDGQRLVAGGPINLVLGAISVFSFDPTAALNDRLIQDLLLFGDGYGISVEWMPSSLEYIASGGFDVSKVFVFKYNRTESSLDLVDNFPVASDSRISWRPTRSLLGAGDSAGDLFVLLFDPELEEAATGATSLTDENVSQADGVKEQNSEMTSLIDDVLDNQVPTTPGPARVPIIEPNTNLSDDRASGILAQSAKLTALLEKSVGKNMVKSQRFLEKNLQLGEKLADFYKKNITLKNKQNIQLIDVPGEYKLHKDFYGVILIAVDNVTLDLNNCSIISDISVPITIEKNIKNISIKNRKIIGGNQYLGAPSGILISQGVQKVTLENLIIKYCYEGVSFAGMQEGSVTDCLVQNCNFMSNIRGATLDCSEYITFRECDFLDCFLENVDLENIDKNFCG